MTGPFVILTTMAVLGTGIMLAAKLPRMLWGRADHARHLLAARVTRWLLLSCSLAAGLGLAFATYHLSAKFGGSHSIIP
jgi:hypothetical protein